MKLWSRLLVGCAALLLAAAAHAQTLNVTGVSASPSSTAPGGTVTFTISVGNSGAQFSSPSTGSFTLVLRNLVTNATISYNTGPLTPTGGLVSAAVVNPTTGQTTPGSGSFTYTAAIPTQFTESGGYGATATLTAVTAGTIGTASYSVNTSVVTVAGTPDLQITSLTYAASTSYTGGTVIPMSLTYRNNSSTNGTTNVPYTPGINGHPAFVRIQVVLSTNPTFGDADDFQLTISDINAANAGTTDNAGNPVINADNSTHTISWNQILPGNFAGSYYVLAKIDSTDALTENDPAALTVDGNNIWGVPALSPQATRINLLPSNFPATFLASHKDAATTSSNGYSDNPSITTDGRYVVFASDATNLVSGDANATRDIFIYDSQTTLVRRLSVSQQGAAGNGPSNDPKISGNGRYVAFASDANNLIVGDTNGFSDIYVVDTLIGLIERVSVTAAGAQANNPSFRPSISSTGRYIVFESSATNLDPTYTAVSGSHIYLHDRDVSGSGTFDTAGNTSTRLVDVDLAGPATSTANAAGIQATISPDGSTIAFASRGTNLVAPATTAGRQHVYVRPRANVGTGTSGIKLISVVNATGVEGNADSQTPSLTNTGNWVAFASLATNLVAGDTNGVSDIFVYDNTAAVGAPVVRRVSVSTAGAQGTDSSAAGFQLGSINPTISSDGRYVAYASLDSNLTPAVAGPGGDINGQAQATDSNNALDIFVRDRDVNATGVFDTAGNVLTQMVSLNTFGYQTNSILGIPSTAASNIYPVISANGRFVAFPSDSENNGGLAFGATNLLPLDSNGVRDIFISDRRTTAAVTPNTPPTVTITSPGSGSTVLVNTPTSLTASATTTIGVIASVQFFVNGSSVGTSTVFPYSAAWTPTAVGNYTLSALVTDSFGNIGVSPNVTVAVVAAPSVGITSPVASVPITVGTPQTVTAVAAASNPGATIASVQFFVDGTSLGAPVTVPPYTASWTPAATGTFTLTAVAIDSLGTRATSPGVAITVNAAGGGGGGGVGPTPPGVSITSPASGTALTVNVPQVVTATATSNSGGTISSVKFFANGVSIGSSSFPYRVTWTPSAPGTYALTAVATDTNAATATSAASVVTVSAGGTPPVVTLTSPNTGSTYSIGSSVTLSATASLGTAAISGVEFFVNGFSLGALSTPPFTKTFTPIAGGSYTVVAVVTDITGNQASSTPSTFTVTTGTAPTVSIVTPAGGATLPVNIQQFIIASVSASSASIANVQFFANGVSLGTVTSFPYIQAWTPSGPGAYLLTAIATDTQGVQTTSAAVSVAVTPTSTTAPAVILTSPPTNTKVTVNTAVELSAVAKDPDGTVSSVSFLVNNQVVATSTKSPYAGEWLPTTPGTYTVTALATDDAGNRTTSAPSTITVLAAIGSVPIGALEFNNPKVDTPAAGATPTAVDPLKPVDVSYGSKLIFHAGAVDQDGTIANVQFFVNGTSIATVTSAPYLTVYSLNTLSDVAVTAIVTDSSGNAVYTNPIFIATQPAVGVSDASVSMVSPGDGGVYVAGRQITFSATHNFGNIDPPKIDFYVDGSQFTTVTKAAGGAASEPYTAVLGITRPGTYVIHAVARRGNATTVSAPARITVVGNFPPTISITTPISGSSLVVGNPQTIVADASDSDGIVQNVQFFVNGILLSSDASSPFTATWSPAVAGKYVLTAAATDDTGAQTLSAPITVMVTNNQPPTVAITGPASGVTVGTGTVVNLTANATDADGKVASVRFLANGVAVGSVSASPFVVAWTPTAAGSYTVIAQATDDSGNVTSSSSITVNVTANRAPTVSLTAPVNGTTVRVASGTTLTATAADADGTIASVQFFANGTSVGAAVTAPPYRAQWTPNSEGIYQITAVATDNAGTSTTSSAVTVLAVTTGAGDVVYVGNYLGGGESGKFAVINVRGKTGSLIAYSTSPTGRIYFYPSLLIDASGGFSLADSSGKVLVSGTVNDTGVVGTLDGGRVTMIGPAAFAIGSAPVAAGYYNGNLVNRPGSTLAAIVGADASIAIYATDGSFRDAGSGSVTSTGSFTVTTPLGNRFTGTVDPATGFLTGALSGALSANFMAANASGSSFSDGFLRNLSTRGQVGTGANLLIAGFVVAGNSPKQVLIRAVGPTLTTFGIAGALVDTQLELFNGNTRIASNDNWSGDAAIAAASSLAGAFPLSPSSFDSVLLMTLPPGSYTAQVSGVAGRTGIALIELYDIDSLQPFSSQKVTNVATRGVVGTGQAQLIAGFVVSGNTAKKVLIRAVGPTLGGAPFNVSGALADPFLRLVRGDSQIVRENDNWEQGNDAALLSDAAVRVGAFPLAAGSRDAAILINLPPGTYSAQVSGAGTTTGVALVEVYEVP